MSARELVFKRRGRPDLRALLGDVLDEGGTAYVHEARAIEPAAGQPATFAVKRARRGAERFVEKERAACARFDHPHLVSYLGSAADPEEGLLLALEILSENPLLLTEQGALRCRFRDPGTLYYPLPPGVAIELAFDLILALEHLHAHGCVHADVKLANFMVRTPEREPRAALEAVARGEFEGVLADLGSVRSLEWVRQAERGLEAEDFLPAVTPIYAPPETVLDGSPLARRLSPSMDSYAFALVFHALLTGRAPYDDLVAWEEARHPWVLSELKTREARGELSPVDDGALDDLPLHDVAFERGMRAGWPRFRSAVGHLLRRCTDPDPARRMDARAARLFMERELDVRRSPEGRAWRQRTFTMHPLANRLTGDRPLGKIRIADGSVETEAPGPPRRSVARSMEVGRLLAAIRGSGELPAGGPFLVAITGTGVPAVLAARVHWLGEWLAPSARGVRWVRVGRGAGNEVSIDDPLVSAGHVIIERDEAGGYSVRHVATGERRALPLGARSVALSARTTITLVETEDLEGFLEATLRGARVRATRCAG